MPAIAFLGWRGGGLFADAFLSLWKTRCHFQQGGGVDAPARVVEHQGAVDENPGGVPTGFRLCPPHGSEWIFCHANSQANGNSICRDGS